MKLFATFKNTANVEIKLPKDFEYLESKDNDEFKYIRSRINDTIIERYHNLRTDKMIIVVTYKGGTISRAIVKQPSKGQLKALYSPADYVAEAFNDIISESAKVKKDIVYKCIYINDKLIVVR